MRDSVMNLCSLRTLLPAVSALLLLACRPVQERSALAQLPAGGTVALSAVEATSSGIPGATVRRLWSGDDPGFYASSVSPDGRYLTVIDWSTFDLAVRDLKTGALHHVTHIQRQEGDPWEEAEGSLFSRDGRQLAFRWYVEPDLELRVMDFAPDEQGLPRAATPRVIFHNPEFYPYVAHDWSPDGSQILESLYSSAQGATTIRLTLIDARGGGYRVLKSFDWRDPGHASFSPDGRFVAYDFPPDVDVPNRDLFVLSVDGTSEVRIVSSPADDRIIGWHPDGSILFTSDRNGTPGVWRLPMSDGRPAGPAELLKADIWGLEPLGFGADRFYYGLDVNPPRLYVGTVDLETGRLTSTPTAVTDPTQIRISGWEWSRDGKFLALSGSVPGAPGSMILIRSDAGQEVRSLRLDLTPTTRIRWAPDGKSLVVFAADGKGRRGFYRIDYANGTYSSIVRADELNESIPRGDFDISLDGRTLWFASNRATKWTLNAYDIESGTSRPITPVEWQKADHELGWHIGFVAVSPDGSRLAVFAPDTLSTDVLLGTIPVAGGPFTAVARVPGIHGPAAWSPDGRFVVYNTFAGVGDPQTWAAPIDGGEVRQLELDQRGNGYNVKLHPDGRRISFMSGESRGEVWVMEGLGRSATSSARGGSR